MIKKLIAASYLLIAAPAFADWPVALVDKTVFYPEQKRILLNVIDNDVGEGLSVKSANQWSEKGGFVQVAFSGNGKNSTIVYVAPNDFVGEDGFWYVIEDDQGRTNSARVSIDVKPANSNFPAPQEDLVEVPQGSSIRFDVLKNDVFTPTFTSRDGVNISGGEILEFNKWSQNGGKIEKVKVSSLDSPSTLDKSHLKYTPKPGFVGEDYFWYTIKDRTADELGTSPQFTKVTINVLEDKTISAPYPVANPDQRRVSCVTGGGCGLTSTRILENDIGKGLIVKLDSLWSLNGRAIDFTESDILYPEDSSNLYGEDTVFYIIEDVYGRQNWSYLKIN